MSNLSVKPVNATAKVWVIGFKLVYHRSGTEEGGIQVCMTEDHIVLLFSFLLKMRNETGC